MKRAESRFFSADQQGNVVIAVMISMLLIVLLVAALVEHFLVAEARAVEESLAKVRVYWALSGHVDYFYSRVMGYASNCGAGTNPTLGQFSAAVNSFDFVSGQHNTCDTVCNATNDAGSAQEVIQCFMNDLETDQTTDNRTWGNYDGNAAYTFAIQHLPGVDAGVGALQFSLVNPGTIDVLSGLDQRLLPLHVQATLDGTPALTITQYERF